MSLTLAPIFGSNMVLQQGTPVPVWGTAAPGASITVSFRGQRANAKADAQGRWKAHLSALTASSEPAELIATAAGSPESRVAIQNVLVGEVWVCSGQSNMEWPVSQSNDPEKEISSANFPAIRLLTVPKVPATRPQADLGSATWEACAPQAASAFSAVGYFFGRELHRKLNVPIGLINASWGGTVAEAWTSFATLQADPALKHFALNYDHPSSSLTEQTAKYKKTMADLAERTGDHQNLGVGRGWAGVADPSGPSGGEWKDMHIPGTWAARGVNHHGILWHRRNVDLPAAWAGKDLELTIGATDKSDTTYFNGEKVGGVSMKDRPDAWCFVRTYPVPARLVKAGKNVIAVRVHADMYAAGMTGPAELMKLRCPSIPAAPAIPLAGTWRYAVEADYGLVLPPALPAGPDNPNSPSVLFNGLISPLLSFPIRGAIWYQGESNVGRAKEYRTLFAALINDWRRAWANPNLAFHFVQLANFMAMTTEPGESLWAELREAQALTLSLPHTGMAVAIEIGEEADIHPKNKQDVGRRLAANALHHTYGKKDVVPCGPLFREAKREGTALRVSFAHAEGLNARGGELKGFAVAGADRRFVWARARIDGSTVVVSSDAVREPTIVRYAWADNPVANLYNAAALPASPFRSDRD